MPGEDLQSWSTTAATNSNADTSINWAEGQPRASVNNSARSMMAAHAKDRNLQNGSITTTGTANAQAFASGIPYTTVPTGLRVLLKIGVALSNTGATTLNMDGIGAVTIKDQFGSDLVLTALIAGKYAEFVYNGTNWILLDPIAATLASPQCGRLAFVSSTALSFTPLHGDRIRINSVTYAIPSAGIAGLVGPGSVFFINGVGSSAPVASTLYYVYAFINSGVVTADFSTTTHATSTTAGNIGTEIKSGDDSRTLVGMIRTNSGGGFQSDAANRTVISWFNRRNIDVRGASTAGATTVSTTAVALTAAANIGILNWSDEAVLLSVEGTSSSSIDHAVNGSNIYLDGPAQLPQGVLCGTGTVGQFGSHSGVINVAPAEGYHVVSPMGFVLSGTGSFFLVCSAMIRG